MANTSYWNNLESIYRQKLLLVEEENRIEPLKRKQKATTF